MAFFYPKPAAHSNAAASGPLNFTPAATGWIGAACYFSVVLGLNNSV
jgi:hypothetical protein